MGAQGTATLDFGAFPGKSDASVTVTGLTGIQPTSLVEAWLHPAATADHSADEHLVESIKVMARPDTIVTDSSFRIDGVNTSEVNEPLDKGPAVNPLRQVLTSGATDPVPYRGGKATRIYGQWTVAWVWN
jgi:hypothetical protein